MGINSYSQLTPTDVVFGLLNQLHVRVTRASVSDALQNHPDYPSLLSISDVLKQWKVSSTAIKADKSKLNELFLRYRRKLDYKRFAVASKENSATIQLIYGMQEIKLNNAELLRHWQWEGLQALLFKLNFKSLSLG